MPTIQESALALLKAVYEVTEGNSAHFISSAEIGEKIGLSDERADAAARYLCGKSMFDCMYAIGESPFVRLTSYGIDQIEGALQHPTKSSAYFPPITNILHIGVLHGGIVQQGNVGNNIGQQNLGMEGADLVALAEHLSSLSKLLQQQAVGSDQLIAVGRVAEAEKAARDGDQHKLGVSLSGLGGAKKWVLDVAQTSLSQTAVKMIMRVMGL